MGGNVGGSFSSGNFADLEQKIMERLRALAQSANKVLFACEEEDQRALLSHMRRSDFAVGDKVSIAIGPNVSAYAADIQALQLLVTFSDATLQCTFLDGLVEAAFRGQKQCIHVRAHPDAPIPSKVLAYRWRVMSWDELVTLLQ